jgi:hypothetical protein
MEICDELYSRPLLSGRATAAFFHEVFGHRIEGHRQKSETEGQTLSRSPIDGFPNSNGHARAQPGRGA